MSIMKNLLNSKKKRTITDELRIEKGLDHEVSYFEN